MTTPEPLVIRADAGAEIGTGHVMRCLALAQAWQDAGGRAVFLMSPGASSLQERLRGEKMDVVLLSRALPGSPDDADETVALTRRTGASWVAVDGYHFGADYQHRIKEARLRVLFLDDYGHAGHYWADIVLNQNLHAEESLYANREPSTRLLLGTGYALLRREFTRWQGWKRAIPPTAHRVLVTLGGSDPDNVTLKVLRALQRADTQEWEAVVILGGSSPHRETLRSCLRGALMAVRVLSDVRDMARWLKWADVAVSAGGATCWEMAFLGLPNAILVLAENQEDVAGRLAAGGVSVNLGRHASVGGKDLERALCRLMGDEARRREMSERGRRLVDGYGAARTAAVLQEVRR